jgi:hypothetical protein
VQVLNKYYPPDFDPELLPKNSKPRDRQVSRREGRGRAASARVGARARVSGWARESTSTRQWASVPFEPRSDGYMCTMQLRDVRIAHM